MLHVLYNFYVFLFTCKMFEQFHFFQVQKLLLKTIFSCAVVDYSRFCSIFIAFNIAMF